MLTIPLGSLPEVFGFVAQTLSQKGIILDYYFLFWDKVWATKPRLRATNPKESVMMTLVTLTMATIPCLAVSFT